MRDLFVRSKFGQLTPSCSRTNCTFLLPSSSSDSSNISRLQPRLHQSLGQGIAAAPAPQAAVETLLIPSAQSLLFPGEEAADSYQGKGMDLQGYLGTKQRQETLGESWNSSMKLQLLPLQVIPRIALPMRSTSRPPRGFLRHTQVQWGSGKVKGAL